MTYRKNGYGASPLVATGFTENVFVDSGTAFLESVVGGDWIVPGERQGHVHSPFSASGMASRLQATPLEWDGMPQEPVVRFTGACSRPYVENVAEGKHVLVRVSLAQGETLEVDMAAHTVKKDGEMVWGYTGRWFSVKPGDVLKTGATGIGAGFSAEIDLRETGLITKTSSGRAVLSLFGSGVSE